VGAAVPVVDAVERLVDVVGAITEEVRVVDTEEVGAVEAVVKAGAALV
jgi:hypothetical protein